MTFKEIFNEEGLYKAESFADGVCFYISKEGYLFLLTYKSKDDLLPSRAEPLIYKGLFDKEYYKILNKKQLFK